MDMLMRQCCGFFPTDFSKSLIYIGKLQHQKRQRVMMAKFGGRLQRDRIYKPMAAESVSDLQRCKKYCSMMAVHIMVLQRGKIYRRMMATDEDGLTGYIMQGHISSCLCLHYSKRHVAAHLEQKPATVVIYIHHPQFHR